MHRIITRDLMKARITDLHRQAERDALALARPPHPASADETGDFHVSHDRCGHSPRAHAARCRKPSPAR